MSVDDLKDDDLVAIVAHYGAPIVTLEKLLSSKGT